MPSISQVTSTVEPTRDEWFRNNKLQIDFVPLPRPTRSRLYHIPSTFASPDTWTWVYMTSLNGIKIAVEDASMPFGNISIPVFISPWGGGTLTAAFSRAHSEVFSRPRLSMDNTFGMDEDLMGENLVTYLNENINFGGSSVRTRRVSRTRSASRTRSTALYTPPVVEPTTPLNAADLELVDFSDFRVFASMHKEIKSSNVTGPEFSANGIPGMGEDFTFGLEIEVDFPDHNARNRLAEKLYEAGLSNISSPARWQYAARRTNDDGSTGHLESQGTWSVEFDRTVDDVGGERGAELVSPILRNNAESWHNVQIVINILNELGAIVNTRHGLHVNIGSKSFGNEGLRQDYLYSLLYLQAKFDDVIIRLSQSGSDSRNHRGRYYCNSIADLLCDGDVEDNGDVTFSSHTDIYQSLGYALDSRSLSELHHLAIDPTKYRLSQRNNARIEFRTFDATLDLGRIQTNVMLSASMFKKSTENDFAEVVNSVTSPLTIPRPGNKRANNPRRRLLSNAAWKEDSKEFRELVNLLELNKFNARNLTACYSLSRWQ